MTAATTDTWFTDPAYGGIHAECGKNKCRTKASRVVVASMSHRVVCCEEHEAELLHLKELMRNNPNPSMPPTETVQWRRDDR